MHLPDRQSLPGTELLRLARGSIEYGFVHREPLPLDFAALPNGGTRVTIRLRTTEEHHEDD